MPQSIIKPLFFCFVSFLGLISCTEDPDNSVQADTWELKEPKVRHLSDQDINLRAYANQGEGVLTFYDHIYFDSKDHDEGLMVKLHTFTKCIAKNETNYQKRSVYDLKSQMQVAWFLPDELLFQPEFNENPEINCSFDFKAVNIHGSTHSFHLAVIKIHVGTPQFPIEIKKNNSPVQTGDLISESELATTFMNFKDTPANRIHLRCQFFELKERNAIELSHINFTLFDFTKVKGPKEMLDPLREVEAQPCRIFVYENELLKSSSVPFYLHFPWPELQVETHLEKEFLIERSSEAPIKTVRLSNPSSTPLYAFIENKSGNLNNYIYDKEEKIAHSIYIRPRRYRQNTLLVRARNDAQGEQLQTIPEGVAISVPPHSSIELTLYAQVPDLTKIKVLGYGLAIQEIRLHQSDRNFESFSDSWPILNQSEVGIRSFSNESRASPALPDKAPGLSGAPILL